MEEVKVKCNREGSSDPSIGLCGCCTGAARWEKHTQLRSQRPGGVTGPHLSS